MKQSNRNYSTYLLWVTLSLIALLVLGTSYLRYQDFLDYHHTIADSATDELSHAVAEAFVERQRLVQLFASDRLDILEAVVRQPLEELHQDKLAHEIRRLFPDYFAYTLTDRNGTPLIDDFDGYIGELCLNDVRSYAQSGINNVRVHPNAVRYHYDVMATWGDQGNILLISFPAEEISALLKTSQAPGHELIILLPDAEDLIEITALGARDSTPREDYRLPDNMRQRILASKPIQHTHWLIADLWAEGFTGDFKRTLTILMSALLGPFAVFILIIGWAMRSNETQRRAAEQVKDEFISVVSHELRTPLTSIQGSLGLMLGGACGELSDKALSMLNIANNNVERLRLLVDDLLDIRKIEAGKLQLEIDRVDVMQIMRNALEQNRGYAQRFNATFKLTAMTEGVYVQADSARIEQVLGNLLSNAVKFSPPNTVVEVSVQRIEEDKVEFAVRDHGHGINPADHEKLFQKFVQLDAGDTRRSGGTGLGLAIVKALIEAHHGSVHFESRPDHGSRFSFILPVA